MSWYLVWGPHEEKLEALQEKGQRVEALEERPELRLDLYPIWEGFHDLSMSRPTGFGPGGIPLSEMLAWLDYRGYTDQAVRQEYVRLFRAMDTLTLRHYVEEREKNGKT